jgi:hypothetical protein
MDLASALPDLGHELDGARRAPDHRDAPVREIVIGAPRRGVEERALEGVEALDLGPDRLVEHPDRADDDVRDLAGARLEDQGPARRRLVPFGPADAVAETDMRQQAVLRGDPAQVVENLGLGRIGLRPVGLRLEGEGVERRLDVALAARVAIEVPGPADGRALLEDHEVREALVEQAFAHAEATGPRADDRDPHPSASDDPARPAPPRAPKGDL